MVMADRFMYLPQIGICVALVWGTAHVAGPWVCRRLPLAAIAVLVVAGSMVCAWQQTSHWRDSVRLWTHTLACPAKNPIAHNNLGLALADCGQIDGAIAHYRKALEIKPDHELAHNNLGLALASRGQLDEAIAHYRKALEIKPEYVHALYNLGNALAGRGQVDEAIAQYRKALKIKPDYAAAHHNLGNVLAGRGQVDEAIAHFRNALEIRSDLVAAHVCLGDILVRRGQVGKAITHYQQALQIRPDDAAALNDLAWIRATYPDPKFRDGPQAVTLARRAIELSSSNANALDTLAAAYAEAGRFADAVRTAHKGVDLARQQGKPALAESIQVKIPLYNAGMPFHESPAKTSIQRSP